MKKAFLLLVGIFFLGVIKTQAQCSSKNFNNSGITEYLKIKYTPKTQKVFYYTSKDSKPVQLKLYNEVTHAMGFNADAKFPNRKGVYKVVANSGGVYLTHPNKKEQHFSCDDH